MNEVTSKIQLLFFGATADAIGERQTEMSIIDGTRLDSIIGTLAERYPQLSSRQLLVAVNEEYAPLDRPVMDGDRIAVFTPVSGG